MNTSNDLLAQESHFEFGKNWASYARLITETDIETAVSELQRLLGGRLDRKRFLDIGCGSGLHSLAALRLGASEVVAIDIDPHSVATAREVLGAHAPDASWRTLTMSIFELDPEALAEFDVVYSWGVLHHTGDLHRALARAAKMVRSGGQFAFALYRKTFLCWLWKIEKRWYAHRGPRSQRAARAVYLIFFRIACVLKLRSFKKHLATYRVRRGMDFMHDIHDWMGGWPYESIRPGQVDSSMRALGFRPIRSFVRPGFASGVLGSGCDEYVYSKVPGAK